jgi:hypothetical protein
MSAENKKPAVKDKQVVNKKRPANKKRADSNKHTGNRKYKDSVFTKLLGDKKKLVEVYNAVDESTYKADEIEHNTLPGILFLNRMNDISFTIGNRLIVLLEHQSTINQNMPLRLLLYIAQIYESIVDNKAIYKRMRHIIPRPEFIVLYNGVEEYPDESFLNLSDAFYREAGVAERKPELELTVRVLNINAGHNRNIMEKSATLKGYATFIAKVREYQADGLALSEAITKAVKYCIGNGILEEFLLIHGAEVINMLNVEFNLDDALQVAREEGAEIG